MEICPLGSTLSLRSLVLHSDWTSTLMWGSKWEAVRDTLPRIDFQVSVVCHLKLQRWALWWHFPMHTIAVEVRISISHRAAAQ